MGDSRVSNKDIASKLDTLIDLMTANALATPSVPAVAAQPTEGGKIEVDAAYLTHMKAKASDHATTKGSEVVLYGRKNKGGEIKLAYALRERFDEVVAKQPSCLGEIESYSAA
jgi:hypothetical protein